MQYTPLKSASDTPPQPDEAGGAIRAAFSANRIAGLDSLRAVAVLMVMLGHAFDGGAPWDKVINPLSGLGVNLFFVLSGLLITRLLLDEAKGTGRIGLLGFYRRRVARLMPAFYLYLAVGVAILWVRHKPIPWDAVLAAMLYVINYHQAFHGAPANLVSHCWSLAVEEQFYIVWPVLVSWLLRRQFDMARSLCLLICGIWVWRAYLTFLTDTSVDYLYRALDTRADGLAMGCLTAVLLSQAHWRQRMAKAISWPGAGTVLVALLLGATYLGSVSKEVKYGLAYVIQPVLIALVILKGVVVATQGGGWSSAWLRQSTIAHIGQVSYFMYLFHGLIMYTVQHTVEAHTGSFGLGLLLAILAVYLCASASFKWFETPMRRLISGH